MPIPRESLATMPTLHDAFAAVCDAVLDRFGEPDEHLEALAPFDAVIELLLARELGGARGQIALDALVQAGLLTPGRLADAEVPEISDALREKGITASAGSIAPLRHFSRWLVDHHGGRVECLFDPHRSTDWLRGELASIRGIGLTTADAILLFALERPSYPVDRATFRVLVRHDWLDPTATYDDARDLLLDHSVDRTDEWGRDPASVLARLASGMEHLGRRYCRAAAPKCNGCPLESFLPEGGPRELDA
jgi:endonuclease-3 related protein